MSRMFIFFYYIIFILTLNIFVFQANAYDFEDEEINEKKSLVNLNNNEKLISNIKTKQEACKILNHKVVTYIDLIYYVKNCNLMLINDPEVSNNLIQDQRKSIVSLSANVYAMMPIGNNYMVHFILFVKNMKNGSLHLIVSIIILSILAKKDYLKILMIFLYLQIKVSPFFHCSLEY